ncbi:MAG: ATP-binding protein [Acidobacteriota bacterium]
MKPTSRVQQPTGGYLDAAESEWQAMVDAVPVGILYLGRDREVLRANRLARELLGPHTRLDELTPDEPWASAVRLCDLVFTAGADDFMEALDAREGITWEISVSRLRSEETAGCAIMVLRDITERIQLERQLRRRERMSAIGTLVHGINHKLRSDLFGVTGLADVLEVQIGNDPQMRSCLDMQRQQTQRILRMLDLVIQYAGPDEPNRTRGRIESVIETAIAEARAHTSSEVEAFLSVASELPSLVMDRDRLALALGHILKNAFEHSPESGVVELKASILEGEAFTRLLLDVEDQGPGVLESELPKIFEPFYTYRSEGQGMGLPIARRIVEDHGGRLTVENREEGGCRVSIMLPVTGGSSTSEGAEHSP